MPLLQEKRAALKKLVGFWFRGMAGKGFHAIQKSYVTVNVFIADVPAAYPAEPG